MLKISGKKTKRNIISFCRKSGFLSEYYKGNTAQRPSSGFCTRFACIFSVILHDLCAVLPKKSGIKLRCWSEFSQQALYNYNRQQDKFAPAIRQGHSSIDIFLIFNVPPYQREDYPAQAQQQEHRNYPAVRSFVLRGLHLCPERLHL